MVWVHGAPLMCPACIGNYHFFPNRTLHSHRIRVPVFAMIPVHLADKWKRE